MHEIHYTPGRFVWHDLVTTDLATAEKFYGELVGWEFRVAGHKTEHPYRIIAKNGHDVGGLMLRPGRHVPPHVMGYVSVLDVEYALTTARTYGGAVLAGPMDVGPGQLAIVQDPQGAIVGVWKYASGDPPEVITPAVGSFCWDQLNTSDAKTAVEFYGRVFGWQREAFPGSDDLSLFMRGARQAASVMQAAQGTFAHWLAYIMVTDLAATRARVKGLGGQVMVEEVQVPGVGRFCVIQDNLGAIVALFQSG